MVPDIDRDPVTSHSSQVPSDREIVYIPKAFTSLPSLGQPYPIFLFFAFLSSRFKHQPKNPTMKGSLVEIFSAMLVAGCFAVLMSDEGRFVFSLSTALVFMFLARCGVREGELITHGCR